MDKIHLSGWQSRTLGAGLPPVVTRYKVMEVKGRPLDESGDETFIDQVLKYVDWVAATRAGGDYDAIDAYLVAPGFSEEVLKYASIKWLAQIHHSATSIPREHLDAAQAHFCSPWPVWHQFVDGVVLIRTASHLYAQTIAEGDFRGDWEELSDVLGTIDPPLRAAAPFTACGRPPTPKRQFRIIGGRRRLAMFPIDQAAFNGLIDRRLRDLGSDRQPVARGDMVVGPIPSGLLGDFAKGGIFVEVEFGNMASAFRDLFKFQIASRSGAGRMGVLVVASDKVARFFDQGVATFEQVTRLLPYMGIGLQLPTVVVGLDLNDWAAVRARYEEMRAVAEENGLDCHTFDDVFGVPQLEVTPDGDVL